MYTLRTLTVSDWGHVPHRIPTTTVSTYHLAEKCNGMWHFTDNVATLIFEWRFQFRTLSSRPHQVSRLNECAFLGNSAAPETFVDLPIK